MKTSCYAILGTLAAALGAWLVLSAVQGLPSPPAGSPEQASHSEFMAKPSGITAGMQAAVEVQPSVAFPARQTHKEMPLAAQQSGNRAPLVTGTSVNPGSPAGSGTGGRASASGIPTDFSSSVANAPTTGTSLPGSPVFTGAPGGATSVLEVEPGVSLPAAFVPPENVKQSPQVAAAQQQIADSFANEMDSVLSQTPTPSADAASDSYYEALDRANEQFRALYGNEAYNSAAMKATLDAAH